MTPVLALIARPGGKPLATDQPYGAVPPLAASGGLYATPGEGPGSEVVVRLSGCGCTVGRVDPLTSPKAAVIVVEPGPIAVARPEPLTVATLGTDDAHVTRFVRLCEVPSVYVPVAV